MVRKTEWGLGRTKKWAKKRAGHLQPALLRILLLLMIFAPYLISI